MRPLSLVALVALTLPGRADDWPHWMGPTRDGVWHETGLLDKFPAGGPKLLWRVPAFGGYSGPAVAAGKVFHFDYHLLTGDPTPNPALANKLTGRERVVCFDAGTGKEVWKKEYDCPYQVSYPAGPRCTPTVHAGKVYALGTMGHLTCYAAADGKQLWAKHLPTVYKAKVAIWGYSGHPLVVGDTLVVLAGGTGGIVALDLKTGAEKWATGWPAEIGYAPPALARIDGQDQLVVFTPAKLAGLDPATGVTRWAVPLDPKPKYDMSIMAPQVADGLVFAGGIGASVAVRPAGDKAAVVWAGNMKTTGLTPVNMTPLVIDGVLYGVDQPGQLRAVRLATGERLWEDFTPVFDQPAPPAGGGSGTAFLVRNGNRVFAFNERGTLAILKLSAEKCEIVDTASLVAPTGSAFGRKVVWSHPAFADKCVFVRNDSEVACFSLAK